MNPLNNKIIRAIRTTALMVLASFVLGSCSGDGGAAPPPNIKTTVIETTGGLATSVDNKVTIQIPAGAVTASTSIAIEASGDKAGQNGVLYKVTGQGGVDLIFQQPVTLKLNYDPATMPIGSNEATLQIGLLGPFDSWEILTDSTVDTVNKVITATTTHFSNVGILSVSNNIVLAPKLGFPLLGRTPFTAIINSVFDHSMVAPYCEDKKIQTYSGDIGQGTATSCMTFEKNIKACGNNKTTQILCDYGTGGKPVAYKNGNTDTSVISYDGHPGYDYRTTDQTSIDGIAGHIKVVASGGGTAHVINDWKFGTVWIDHGNGYSTHYLHLFSTPIIDGQHVNQGDQIGVAGNTAPFAIGPHLHFEVKLNNVPIDPYALNLWSVALPITYSLTTNITGAGSGNVVSAPSTASTSGINCSVGSCTALYNSGATVTLNATPATGSTFVGWSGGCSGTGSCSVTMNANVTVTATFAIIAGGTPGTVTNLDVPGALTTSPAGINNNGIIVGAYQDNSGMTHGFIYNSGTYTTFNALGIGFTFIAGVNDSGVSVGGYQDNLGKMHGFIYSGSTYTTLDFPNATSTFAYGINNNGIVVGQYQDSSGVNRGFTYSSGVYTSFNVPGASATMPYGININGQVVGSFNDTSGTHGFVYNNGAYTTLNVPGFVATQAGGINDSGMIVGIYFDNGTPFVTRSFVYSSGSYTTLAVPGADFTSARGINNNGSTVGHYGNASGTHGFVKW